MTDSPHHMTLDSFQIEENKHVFLQLLDKVDNPGKEALKKYLLTHDFGHMPSSNSTHRHHSWIGGWVQHALGVYIRMVRRNGYHTNKSIVKVGLLHDLCKLEEFYVDNDGHLCRRELRHHGHGALSVSLLRQLGYELTPEEYHAIRWHMGGHHTHTKEEELEVERTRQEKLFQLVHKADREDASDDKSMRAPGTLIIRTPEFYDFTIQNNHRQNRK